MSSVSSASEATTTNNPPQAPTGHGGQELSESQRVDKIQYPKEDEPRLQGQNAFNSERPLNVQPTQAGGVARGGRDDVPLEKAGLVDKVVGKTEKVIGKATNNPDKHEAGELRETGGKNAVTGQARALDD